MPVFAGLPSFFLSILLLFVFTMVPQAGALAHGEEKQGRGGGHGSARVRREEKME